MGNGSRSVVQKEFFAPTEFGVIDSLVEKGDEIYQSYYINCHVAGSEERRYSFYPNIGNMSPAMREAFKAIVLDGAFAANGMASFSDLLSKEDVEALQHYVIKQPQDLYRSQNDR